MPDEPLGRVPVTFGVINVWVYGMNTWGDLFNARQKLALICFVETEIFVKEIYEKAGIGFRVYKNTLFVIALDTSQWSILKKSLKRYLALNQIQKDIELMKTLTQQRIAELKEKIKTQKNHYHCRVELIATSLENSFSLGLL